MLKLKRILPWVLCAAIALSLGIIFSQYINQDAEPLEGLSATVLSDGKTLPAFLLKDHLGQAFTNESFMGHWSFVFFGYTHCPDICPTSLSLLSQVDQALKKEPGTEIPKTVFISIDPERDTVTQLAEYVPYFNPDFIGVTGNPGNLKVLTTALGVAFGKEGRGKNDGYEMFHGARIMLIDPEARFKALFSSPHDVNEIVSDYKRITGS